MKANNQVPNIFRTVISKAVSVTHCEHDNDNDANIACMEDTLGY